VFFAFAFHLGKALLLTFLLKQLKIAFSTVPRIDILCGNISIRAESMEYAHFIAELAIRIAIDNVFSELGVERRVSVEGNFRCYGGV
jgi:hypothetical protein